MREFTWKLFCEHERKKEKEIEKNLFCDDMKRQASFSQKSSSTQHSIQQEAEEENCVYKVK